MMGSTGTRVKPVITGLDRVIAPGMVPREMMTG
jgi:hypothetical protein